MRIPLYVDESWLGKLLYMLILSVGDAATWWALGVKVRTRTATDAFTDGFGRIAFLIPAICSEIAQPCEFAGRHLMQGLQINDLIC